MSEYNDILYDPRAHTHTSCIDEVANADAAIVVIGSRFGGRVVPQALQKVDLEALETVSKSHEILRTRDNISITQLEILKAIEASVPIFTFVDDRVLQDHATYERNKTKSFADQIEYSAIEQPNTAVYIFEFINFLRHRVINNAITPFARIQDIEESLRRQWSALIQRLLFEERSRQLDTRRIDALTDQFEDLKAAILAAIGGRSTNEREIARGVMRFRKLIDFVRAFELPDHSFLTGPAMSWQEFLDLLKVTEILQMPREWIDEDRNALRRTAYNMVRSDGTFFEVDRIFDPVDMRLEWEAFMNMPPESRAIIIDALSEMRSSSLMPRRFIRHVPMSVDEYIAARSRQISKPREPANPSEALAN
jgi:hypothetical protein